MAWVARVEGAAGCQVNSYLRVLRRMPLWSQDFQAIGLRVSSVSELSERIKVEPGLL